MQDQEIGMLIEARIQAKKKKNFAEADRIRDALALWGIILQDTPEGTTYKLVGFTDTHNRSENDSQ